jgi:hypothetical protein
LLNGVVGRFKIESGGGSMNAAYQESEVLRLNGHQHSVN